MNERSRRVNERSRRVMHDSASSERTAKADGMANTVHQEREPAERHREIDEGDS